MALAALLLVLGPPALAGGPETVIDGAVTPSGRPLSTPRGLPAPRKGEPIVKIQIETHNVFDLDKPGESIPPFHWANAIHIVTKEKVVRREVLFSEGDPYDPALLQETERNLRALPFIRKAEVIGVETSSGCVVVVRTWDSWTIQVTATFNRAGGVNQTRAGLAEGNLLGRGKTAGVLYSGPGPDTDRTLNYRDPQVLNQHLVYELSAGESNLTRHYSTSLTKPFYASIARYSLAGGGNYVEDRSTIYGDVTPVGTVARRTYAANLTYGYALAATTRKTNRLSLSLVHDHADFMPAPGESALFIPDETQHTGAQVSWDFQELDFIKQRRIQKLSREEDINMGFGMTPILTYAPRSAELGTTGALLNPRLELRKGFSSELGQIVLFKGDYSSNYVNGGNGMRLASIDAQYYCRYFPRHTAAAHVEFVHGWRLDGADQLTLGEDTGLRGYRAGQFQGNRLLLLNAEDRIFLVDNLWKLVDAGAVVFVDSGYVWPANRAFAPSDLKTSYGFGLRIGATRSSDNEPVRIDVAHAVNDNHFPSRWTISIQTGRAFGSN